MKYSIHGFYQPRAVELGLTNDDLLVLRWFVDFAGTNKMKTIVESDGIYYWINYATILEDLPVLRISKVTLKRKHFDKLCEVKVLKHKHIKQGGSFSYYAYGINYDTLVYLQDDTPSTNSDYPSTNSDKGYDEIGQPPSTNSDYPYDEKVQTKIHLLNKTSINNKSIKDNNKKKKEFIPPTLEEVKQYCKERQNKIDAEYFYDYFTVSNWIDSQGNEVKSWKQKIITWEKNNKERNNAKPTSNTKKRDGSEYAEYD